MPWTRTRTTHKQRPLRFRPIVECLEERLPLAAGDLDPSFGTVGLVFGGSFGSDRIHAVAVQNDGMVLIAGQNFLASNGEVTLARYDTSGVLDPTFDSDGKVVTQFGFSIAYAVALQLDGKIVVAGAVSPNNGHLDFLVVRFNSDGSLDDGTAGDSTPGDSFGTAGFRSVDFAGFQDQAYGLAIYPPSAGALAGKIVVAGVSFLADGFQPPAGFGVARLNSDGSLDQGFGNGGRAVTQFDPDSFAIALDVLVLPSGGVVAAGTTRVYADGITRAAVAQYDASGTPDTSFSGAGLFTAAFGFEQVTVSDLERQPDGKLILAGRAITSSESQNFLLVRLNSDGNPDGGFGTSGMVVTDFESLAGGDHALAIQSDGRIVVAGTTAIGDNGGQAFALTRYEPSGSLDATFGTAGLVTTDFGFDQGELNFALAVDPTTGNLVAAGSFFAPDTSDPTYALARYLNDTGPPVQDVDVDGVSNAVEDGAPNGGDGNNDGIPDRLQINVTSLPNAVDGRYVTLVSAPGTKLADVLAQEAVNLPEGVELPLGSFSFTVLDVQPGGMTEVQLLLPAEVDPTAYYRFGPTPDDDVPHWYDFGQEDDVGARIDDRFVTLTFVDGAFGDDDLTVDGRIVDGGGPATGSNLISGVVFTDLNGDGDRDDGEPAVANRQLYLDLNRNGVFDSNEPLRITQADGSYIFTGLAPAKYFVNHVERQLFWRGGNVPTAPAELTFQNSSPPHAVGSQLIAADLDADGFTDLATIRSTRTTTFLLVYRNNRANPGALTLLSKNATLSESEFNSYDDPIVEDFNRDGLLDLAAGSSSRNVITVFLNSPGSPGTFVEAAQADYSLPDVFAIRLAAADVNGDGFPDILLIHTSGTLSVLLNNSASPGTFLAESPLIPEPSLSTDFLVQGHFNEDGRLDFVARTDLGNTLRIILSDAAAPNGYSLSPTGYTPGSTVDRAVVGDLNRDGLDDIVVAGQTLFVYLNDPTQPGTFLPPTSVAFGRDTHGLALADFNGDSFLDILVLHATAPLASILTNDPLAPGTFGSPQPFLENSQGKSSPDSLTVGDFDRDLRPDFAYVRGDLSLGIVFRANSVVVTAASASILNLGIQPPQDEDADQVSDGVEDGAPNNGDGNHDGTPDSEQNDVTSLPNAVNGSYLTLEIVEPAGATFKQVSTSRNPWVDLPPLNNPRMPSGLHFSDGFLAFLVDGLPIGGAATVRLTVHSAPVLGNVFWKVGPTQDNPTPHWYEFMFDGTTGMTSNGNQITLRFVDGERGDNDGQRNGTIFDPGGLAFVRAPEVVSVVVNDGAAQRSRVNSLTVTFDQRVSVASGAFVLRNKQGVKINLQVALSEVAGRTVALLTFKGATIIGGSLADGQYTLKIKAAKIRNDVGLLLDGDRDGTAGGDAIDAFFRKFGDADGDRDVDALDAALFDSAFGTEQGEAGFLAYFDYKGDGDVDGKDRRQFKRRRN